MRGIFQGLRIQRICIALHYLSNNNCHEKFSEQTRKKKLNEEVRACSSGAVAQAAPPTAAERRLMQLRGLLAEKQRELDVMLTRQVRHDDGFFNVMYVRDSALDVMLAMTVFTIFYIAFVYQIAPRYLVFSIRQIVRSRDLIPDPNKKC